MRFQGLIAKNPKLIQVHKHLLKVDLLLHNTNPTITTNIITMLTRHQPNSMFKSLEKEMKEMPRKKRLSFTHHLTDSISQNCPNALD